MMNSMLDVKNVKHMELGGIQVTLASTQLVM